MRFGLRPTLLVIAAAMMVLSFSIVASAGASSSAPPKPGPAGKPSKPEKPAKLVQLQLLSFNDYHGTLEPPAGTDATLGAALDPSNTLVGGAAFLATELNELRAPVKESNSLTVAAGDLIGGSPFLSGLFHDEPSVETLEAMGLDVSSVGNHEFDEGITELKRMQDGGCHPVDGCYFPSDPYDGATFKWLAANVTYTATGETVLPPTWTKTIGGVKVGFIGMTLEGTPELVAASGIQGLSFNDEVETANAAAAKLQEHDVEAIVVLLHEGGAQAGQYNGCTGISGPIVAIAENLAPSIDLVITGHTHQPYVCTINDPAGNPRQVTSASSFGRVVTETWLTLDKETHDVVRSATTSTNHLVVRTTPDPTLTGIIDKWKIASAPIANRVVGSITADITNPGNRQQETAMQNLVADGILAATKPAANGGAQMAFINPGGVRAELIFNQLSGGEQPGEIIYGEAFAVQPFGNLLVTMDMTGAKIKAALEQQFFPRPPRARLVLGISEGITYDWLQSAAQGSNVANLELNGIPIDPLATYRVALPQFLADGGDLFTEFRSGTNRKGAGDDLAAFVGYLGATSPVSPPSTNRVNELP